MFHLPEAFSLKWHQNICEIKLADPLIIEIKMIILRLICTDYRCSTVPREPPRGGFEYSEHEVGSKFDDLKRGGSNLPGIKSD